MKSVRYILLLAVAASLGACSHKNEPDPNAGQGSGNMPVVLSTSVPLPASRAENLVPLQTYHNNFAILAWKEKDGTRQYVMSRNAAGTIPYRVNWDATAWIYQGITYDTDSRQYLKYWDTAASKYTFAGYAPYVDADGNPVEGASIDPSTGHLILTGVRAHSNSAPDWMECLYTRTNAPSGQDGMLAYDNDLLDGLTPNAEIPQTNLYSTVPLRFHTLMPVVELRIYNDEGEPITIKDVSIELVDPAKLHVRSDYTHDTGWDPSPYTDERTTDFYSMHGSTGFTAGGSKAEAYTMAVMPEIPQTLTDYKLDVAIRTALNRFTATIDLGEATPAWETGKRYIYYIVLKASEEVILFDVDIELFQWLEGEDSKPDDFPNW